MRQKVPFYLALGFAGALVISGCSNPIASSSPQTHRDSVLRWPAPADVAARVADAGLDLGQMGTAEHYHPQLSLVVGGTKIVVPANIGVDPQSGAMSSLHTHDADGSIHIEADRDGEVFTLGQFFAEWGVDLGSASVGGARATAGKKVLIEVDGKPYTGDPRELQFAPDQQIVVSVP